VAMEIPAAAVSPSTSTAESGDHADSTVASSHISHEMPRAASCGPVAGVPTSIPCCDSEECTEKLKLSCKRTHTCGHGCGGIDGEKQCLPCLQHECVSLSSAKQEAGKCVAVVVRGAKERETLCTCTCVCVCVCVCVRMGA
jgi:hypothetical protein